MKPLLLLQTGDAPPDIRERFGNFDQMFLSLPGLDGVPVRVVHAARGERPEEPGRYRSVIVTGSPAMVTDAEAWSEAAAEWLARAVAAGTPVLGVCYGHQLLAHALGGRVGYHPAGDETGTFELEKTAAGAAEPFLAGLPARFKANLAHSQTVLVPPPGAAILVRGDHDPHQLLGYGASAFSCQFHPEFDRPIMLAYLEHAIQEDPASADRLKALAALAGDTPEAAGLVKRFVEYFAG